jgi:uncharacterized membrane protein SpoIIM required for sporulation
VSTVLRQTTRGFRAEREADWLRFEALLDRAERGSVAKLEDEELLLLPVLYRQALSSLSVARATSLDRALIEYLEALCLRGYFFMYGPRQTIWTALRAFVAERWPRAVRGIAPDVGFATLLLAIGTVVGYLLVAGDPSWFAALVPSDLANGRGPDASREMLRSVLYQEDDLGGLGAFAAFLFTHNSQVAIFTFALGFAFAAPSVLLIVYNGSMLGAFLALHASHGLAGELGGWLAIHGTTELLAIAIAGGAGLHIGRRIAFPGARSRLAAAREAGRRAAVAMVGVVIMLAVAGLLEGVGRQTVIDTAARYAIGGGALLLWLTYFTLGGRRG